ncbi:MAG: hypothetical protein FJ272_00290 [Planctomycetes bacterium]|nr:hypothetical protein [Planctomycetota bacterium]MBM4083209.1 hypothetical protein [Planctomycetota bacterium]
MLLRRPVKPEVLLTHAGEFWALENRFVRFTLAAHQGGNIQAAWLKPGNVQVLAFRLHGCDVSVCIGDARYSAVADPKANVMSLGQSSAKAAVRVQSALVRVSGEGGPETCARLDRTYLLAADSPDICVDTRLTFSSLQPEWHATEARLCDLEGNEKELTHFAFKDAAQQPVTGPIAEGVCGETSSLGEPRYDLLGPRAGVSVMFAGLRDLVRFCVEARGPNKGTVFHAHWLHNAERLVKPGDSLHGSYILRLHEQQGR